MLQMSISPHPREQCWVIFFFFLGRPLLMWFPQLCFLGEGGLGLGGRSCQVRHFFCPGLVALTTT